LALKLNLGCGKRVFPDYLNIDVYEKCLVEGVDYLQADISKPLPFPDDSIAEVFTCHVIEHIWPWELEDILKDWIRVLKPGGMLVTECPNIVGTAHLLLKADKEMNAGLWKATMNAIYGDPAQDLRTIEHRHKWGFSPKTLMSLKIGLGLKNVRQEPCQFKMKEPRDMRIVGEKG
jgi:ubiquinone/menaquinone biosynthesis C-methylase UbiE